MKKTVHFTVLFTIFLLFAGCASSKVEEVNSCNTFDDDTFSFSFLGKRPVVNIEINDVIFQFLIDSGANHNVFYNKGLKKAGAFLKDFDYESLNESLYYTITISGGNIGSVKFSVETDDKTLEYDGILGIPFLLQKSDVVTFDYKNNKVIFSQADIEGKKEPLIPVSLAGNAPVYFMEIIIENRKEYFLFDTGNYAFVLRSNYDTEKAIYPTEDVILELLNRDYKKTNRFKKVKLAPFSFGNAKYDGMTAIYNDYFYSHASLFAKRTFSSFSSAGYPFFKDRIIQVNFKENTIIIVE